MIWPSLDNIVDKKKKKIDLKNEGLDIFVNIDLRRKSYSSNFHHDFNSHSQKNNRHRSRHRHRHRDRDRRQQYQQQSPTVFSFSSLSSSTSGKYQNINRNRTRSGASNTSNSSSKNLAEYSTPIRNNSSKAFHLHSKDKSVRKGNENDFLTVPLLMKGEDSSISTIPSAAAATSPSTFLLSRRSNSIFEAIPKGPFSTSGAKSPILNHGEEEKNSYDQNNDFFFDEAKIKSGGLGSSFSPTREEFGIDDNGDSDYSSNDEFSDRYSDSDSDSDGASFTSSNTCLSHAVQGASIRIDGRDGVIAFEFKHDHNKNDYNDDDDAESNHNNESKIMNASIHSMDLSISKLANEEKGTKPNNFELSSTNFQRDRDNKKKQFHSLRLACLDVAADQYKKLSIEVPDIIVAQVNEHRNQLQDQDKNRLILSKKGNEENNKKSGEILTNIKRRRKQRQMIRLRTTDEIHVSPCQCALSLVGMRGQTTNLSTSVDAFSESLFGNLFGANNKKKGSTDSPQSKPSSGKKTENEETTSSMVRTHSAFVRDDKDMSSNDKKLPLDESQKEAKHEKHQKPNQLMSHNRTDSGTFDAVGYHEITLIRNRTISRTTHSNSKSHGKRNSKDYADFLDWDAITIRCSNHDELDILVKALKDTSKATVIPFSSNPKEKLKLNKEKLKLTTTQNRKRLCSDPSDRISTNNYCQPVGTSDNPSPNEDSLVGAISEDRPLFIKENELNTRTEDEVTNAPQTPSSQKTMEKNKNRWDFQFNKKEYCELCDLTFTLLTRRHHCRKCQRSICGNCSSMLLVKGGDEKRFCNVCSVPILRKQSEALRGRWNNRYLQSDRLPGKVHPSCHTLGVGVMGKLPHWRTFMTNKVDERPAVGRITIEVLEAIALPSVDMVNGKVDPYVRATITGYDRDMLWTLREWMQQKRYSLCSGYVSSTLSPQWIGNGKAGGELLTLPLISTAGAVLRLEVMHFNVLTNARGKDSVLGVVEIPLSDLPNANLRQAGGIKFNADGKKRSIVYDGYCDRWYRLLASDEVYGNSVLLSKPMPSPLLQETEENKKKVRTGMKSLEEIGKRVQGLCVQPIEWIASAIKLDLPARRPEATCEEHKARSMIHVRIKLNASVQGDILSHAWFPPVHPRPSVPPFDPQILFGRIMIVAKQLAPFRKIQQYLEKAIKWELAPKDCARVYAVFAVHLALLPYCVKFFHVYLFIFLGIRLREMKLESDDDDDDSITSDLPHVDSTDSIDSAIANDNNDQNFQNSPSLTELNRKIGSIEPPNVVSPQNHTSADDDTDDSEMAKLNIAVHWIAKKWLDNKGLEILQFKLGKLGNSLKNLNSVWNGKNPLLTRAAMVYLVISLVLHFIINPRVLWLVGTFIGYFARSPICILSARMFFGFWRGVAKGLRRQDLLDAEILDAMEASNL